MGVAVNCGNCGKATNSDELYDACPNCGTPYVKAEAEPEAPPEPPPAKSKK